LNSPLPAEGMRASRKLYDLMLDSMHSGIGLRPRPLSGAASANLDVIRATAAWAVMWGHLRVLFFARFSDLKHPDWWVKPLYFLTGFGHQAVVVFFVLSGFLISSSVFKSYAAGTWSWRDYAVNRSVRLYIVLIPGLLLGSFWDLTGSSLFAPTGLYSHPLSDLGPDIAQNNLTAGNFIGNLLFLQNIVCRTFGSNGPLWSLANEFWYYALFPLSFFALGAFFKRAIWQGIVLMLFAVSVAVFLGPQKLIGFLIWLAGCVLVIFHARLRIQALARLIPYALISFFVFSACLVAARTGRFGVLGNDLAVGLAFTLFLFSVLQMDIGTRHGGQARTFADFSYSLYVLHFPLLLFIRAWAAPPLGWQPNTAHVILGAIIGMVVLGFAWMVSLVTEKRTRAVQQWFRGKIRSNKGVSAVEPG
jgi:peptidoglycan/LPS O-acetylase OafA/YrhL